MNKFINYKVLFVTVIFSAFFISCEEVENTTGDNKYLKPLVSIDKTNITMEEGETATITMTAESALKDEMTFKLELVGGTGTFRDYMCSVDETDSSLGFGPIGHIVTIPAFQTTATFDITAVFDLLPEGTETLQLRLYSDSYARGAIAEGSDMINVTVTNKTSDDFVAVFDFSQNYYDSFGTLQDGTYIDDTEDADAHAYCDVDFDLEIYDEFLTAPIATSYSSCPESITLDASTPDGTYQIVPSLYTTAGNDVPAEDFFFKTKITMAKPGVWIKEINVNNRWKFSEGGDVQGNPNAYYPLATLVKTGTTYVLKDFDTGDVLASGRIANLNLKSKKNKK